MGSISVWATVSDSNVAEVKLISGKTFSFQFDASGASSVGLQCSVAISVKNSHDFLHAVRAEQLQRPVLAQELAQLVQINLRLQSKEF